MDGILSDEMIKQFLEMETMNKSEIAAARENHLKDKFCAVNAKSAFNYVEYILGSPWRIQYLFDENETGWKGRSFNSEDRIIQVNGLELNCVDNDAAYEDLKKVIRNEVIRAYIFEVGLGKDSFGSEKWSMNEEMVDWFAYNMPRMEDTTCRIFEKLKPVYDECR